MAKIIDIEGIGPVYAEKLKSKGLVTQEDLLEKGASPKGREDIAESIGVNTRLVLEWVNRADLARISGVGEEYSDLLEAAGVDTVPELAQRNPENLLQKMTEINLEKKVVRRLPVLSQVESWIKQAKDLPKLLTY